MSAIAQLRRKESYARLDSRLIRAAWEASTDSVAIVQQGRVLYASPAFARAFGAEMPRPLSCRSGIDSTSLRARKGAQEALRNQLKGPITALLISCEMALQVPELQSAAEAKMRAVYDLAQQVRTKLEVPA